MSDVDPGLETGNEDGGNGAAVFDFRAALPDDLREHSALAPIKDLPSLAKSYISAQEMVGADKIVIPGADADEDAWNDFFGKLGRPETAAGYQLDRPDSLPDGFDYSDETAAMFKQWAHEAGLTPAQANKLHGAFLGSVMDSVGAGQAADRAAVREADTAIRTAWGADYDRNLELAARAVKVLGGEELLSSLGKFGVLSADGAVKDPVIAYAFAEAGKMLGEDMLAGEGDGALPGADAAKRELAQLQADDAHRKAMLDEGHPGHRQALGRQSRLFKLAYGA